MNAASSISSASSALQNNRIYRDIYNTPAKNIVLPGLILGNMAYKLGTEQNPQKRNDILWNSIISWVGGSLLVNLNNGLLPYFTLPAIAGSIALYKIAQKNTPEEKTDTAINHVSWWASGFLTQKVAQLFKLTSSFQTLCAFAVGASIVGPILSAFVKEKVLQKVAKEKANYLGNSINQLNAGYRVGQSVDTNFSPFASFSNTSSQASNQINSGYDFRDPYNLKKLIPGRFV